MTFDRRRFLELLGASAALTACGGASSPPQSASASPVTSATPNATPSKKRILILGGTGFVGPAIVEAARAHGHTLTLFHRGKTNPGLFPDVEQIHGDRITQLDLLKGRDWDAVVDTWAPGPTLVTRAAELLRDHVGHYVYFSTISVYVLKREPIDESSPTMKLPEGLQLKDIKKIDLTTYGPLKALAEEAAEKAMPGRVTRLRAGVISGPNDPSDRFAYWPVRMAKGGEMIAPGAPDDRMQLVDVRDVGAFLVKTIEDKTFGVFNCVGPENASLGAVLDDIKAATKSSASFTWIPTKWLADHDSGGWDDFPLAVPKDNEDSGFALVSSARARAKGFVTRSAGETAKDTLAWWPTRKPEADAPKPPGIDAEKEAKLLAAWKAK